jgi:hypothetical protein
MNIQFTIVSLNALNDTLLTIFQNKLLVFLILECFFNQLLERFVVFLSLNMNVFKYFLFFRMSFTWLLLNLLNRSIVFLFRIQLFRAFDIRIEPSDCLVLIFMESNWFLYLRKCQWWKKIASRFFSRFTILKSKLLDSRRHKLTFLLFMKTQYFLFGNKNLVILIFKIPKSFWRVNLCLISGYKHIFRTNRNCFFPHFITFQLMLHSIRQNVIFGNKNFF